MTTFFDEPFDPSQEVGNTFDLIPAGDYPAQLIEATVAPTNNGSGQQLTGRFQIMEGPYENRQVYFRAMVSHATSEMAQRIGRKSIKDFCDAASITHPVIDAVDFLYKPVLIRIGVEKDKNGLYDDKNVVKRVMPLKASNNVAAPPKANPPPPSQPKPAPVAAAAPVGAPPWRR